MSASVTSGMDVDEFVAGAIVQPEASHHELAKGAVVARSPERSRQAVTKAEIASKLIVAIRAKRLSCDVSIDPMVARVADVIAYAPDIVIRCGRRLDDDDLVVTDPVVVVEVLSPATRRIDGTRKFVACLRLSSLRHCVTVDAERRVVVHHARDASGTITSRIGHEDRIDLDPPGITLECFFPAAGPGTT